VVEKLSKNELAAISPDDDYLFCRTALAIDSVLILYWKVE
jgi:hypothetical protein